MTSYRILVESVVFETYHVDADTEEGAKQLMLSGQAEHTETHGTVSQEIVEVDER